MYSAAPYGVQTPWLLFNIEVDPSELYPLRAKSPENAAALQSLEAAVAEHRSQLGTPPPGVLNVGKYARSCLPEMTACI